MFTPIGAHALPKSLPNRKRLTDLAVARMGPGICWDTVVVGLAIRVGKRTRTWVFGANKRRLGRFPAMKVAEARVRAREIAEHKGVPRHTFSFLDLANGFLAHGRTRKGRPLRLNTINQYRRAFEGYGKPLHNRPVGEITRRDIHSLLSQIANESGSTTASLVRAMLRRLFGYAIETGVVLESNPVEHTPSYSVPRRSRVLRDTEIAALWTATADDDPYSLIVRLCLSTGCRRSEAGGLRWSELSESQSLRLWTVPASRTKNGRELILPLARQTSDALTRWPRVVGKSTLFGTGERGFQNWVKAKARLDAQLNFAEPFSLHDLRRTTQTRMRGIGISGELVNKILNHAMGPIDEAYDHHSYYDEKAAALQLWADKIDELAESVPQIVKIRRS
jgi:integrase